MNIALTAFNLPGFVPIDASKGSKVITRRRLGKAARRGLGDIFGKIKDGVKEGIEKVKDKVGDVIDAGKETIEKVCAAILRVDQNTAPMDNTLARLERKLRK